MAITETCAACQTVFLRKNMACPKCGSTEVFTKPKSKLYWAGAAIYYPLYAVMFIALCAGLYAVMKPIL